MKIYKTKNKFDTIYILKTDSICKFKVYRSFNNSFYCQAFLFKSDSVITNNEIIVGSQNLNQSNTFENFTSLKLMNKYQSGKIDYFDSNSNIILSINLKNGYLDGEWVQYYSSGQLMICGQYQGHAKYGIWYWYYKNSVLMKQGNYFPNVLIYYYNIYKPKPVCQKFVKYYHYVKDLTPDSAIHEILFIDHSLESIGIPYIINFRDGLWIIWDVNGNIIKTKTYKREPIQFDFIMDANF